MRYIALLASIGVIATTAAGAQGSPTLPAPQAPLAPATKLEGFTPSAGTVVTIGFTTFGRVGAVSVDAREVKDPSGRAIRGVVVEVAESQYRVERAFIDADEIDELLRGIDALLEVRANPTSFTQFEVRYQTKGSLMLVAFNESGSSQIDYTVQAGRVTHASSFLSDNEFKRFRALLASADAKIKTP